MFYCGIVNVLSIRRCPFDIKMKERESITTVESSVSYSRCVRCAQMNKREVKRRKVSLGPL